MNLKIEKQLTIFDFEEDNPFHHLSFHHDDADGWISLAQKKSADHFKQYHFRPEELALRLSEWTGENVYFSQNTFYKPQRKIENIRQLRALYVDIDFYNKKEAKNIEQIRMELLHDFYNQSIPEPNLLIHSGRGIVLVWLIDPVPYKALPLWNSVENYLVGKLKNLGADAKSSDCTRIFRVAGTINSNSGRKVTVEYLHPNHFSLMEIKKEYLPELVEYTKGKKKTGRPTNAVRLFKLHNLYYHRFNDLLELVKLRNYSMTGYREKTLFLYRYWKCCFSEDSELALEAALELNSTFTYPLKEKEVIRATKSAEKAWSLKDDKKANEEAIKRGYPGAGYNYTNAKLIEDLDITEDEQRLLSTIIGQKEKRRRNKELKREQRREQGMKARSEYLQEQRDITQDKLYLLKRAMKQHPEATNKELANLLGISVIYIKKLKSKL